MANIKTFLLEVDLYRNGFVFRNHSDRLYERNTLGRYYVGAKNPKEAKSILQKAIGFGSITVPNHQYIPENIKALRHGQIVKWDSLSKKYTDKIAHATDPVNRVVLES